MSTEIPLQLKADLSLKDIGNMINKVVQGWINYYTHYYKSEFYEVLRYINQCLIKWVRRSYKKKNTRSRAEHWLGAVARRDRNLFATGNLEYYHLLEREPYESRGSRTVLMGTQGEVPWVYLLCYGLSI